MLLADEVYQQNVYTRAHPWRSFKSVAASMGLIDPRDTFANRGIQLASFHSSESRSCPCKHCALCLILHRWLIIFPLLLLPLSAVSKGFTGECGRRGGYVELIGFDKDVRHEFYKLASISLCSNVTGQVAVGLQCAPPRAGDPSYALFTSESQAIMDSLARRAVKLREALTRLPGVSCEAPEGALYVFPRFEIPTRAVEAAAAAGKSPDMFYCLALLDATGIVLVPGSGFGQVSGTHHFRSTILPPEDDMDGVIDR